MGVRRAQLSLARKNAGYTQEQFAEALSVDRTTVARWETGRAEPQPFLRPKMVRLRLFKKLFEQRKVCRATL